MPHVQAAMVLVFMFSASWRLTVVTFGARASGARDLAALALLWLQRHAVAEEAGQSLPAAVC